jgi:hypothetical protein
MPSVFVFHYTNSGGLLGILSSKSLFATDYRYLNDVSEGSMIRDLIVPIFEDEIADIAPNLVERGLLKGFYENYGAKGHRLQAEGTYKALVTAIDEATSLFVLSFCRHTEEKHIKHGLLSQWRGYAGSAGFAIEFDETELRKLIQVECDTFAYATIDAGDVRYSEYNDLFDSTVYCGVAGELTRRIFQRDVTDITGRIDDVDDILIKFAQTAPFLKHHGFEEEEEYRIVAVRVGRDKILPKATRREKEIKFRSKDELIVPYIELFKDSQSPLPIKSIIVGPHPSQEKQEVAVRTALKSTPFSVAKVRCSDIPFRR